MAKGEVSVGYLAETLGESQPKISRHLAYLRNAGLVSTRREGKWVYYGIELPSDATAANVLNATLGLAPLIADAGRGPIGTVEDRTDESAPRYVGDVYEEPRPYEPEYSDDWRPEELEVHLL